jgi:CheY-like chemotaxis protein
MGTFEPANDRAKAPCVLVVDDEPTLRRLMRRALAGIGLDVVEAANGLEALERFQTHEVVAVVSDVRMPVMNGLELVEQLQHRAPGVPIVLVSGSEEVRTRAGAQAVGAFDFLAKPFDLFELGCRVLSAVAAHPPRSQSRRVA